MTTVIEYVRHTQEPLRADLSPADALALSCLSSTWPSRDARRSPLTSKYVQHRHPMPGRNVVEASIHGMTPTPESPHQRPSTGRA